MQILNEARDLKSNLVGETIEFRIDATTKAFHVLSNALYKDKIAAILRELGTNAVDSHRAKGITTPFDVHLPTRFEPYFEITDYGLGLTQQQIRDLYTIYFRSDKDHNNDAIGGLGLGSKTPFSYTDSFTVLSKAEGVATLWNPYLDEAGKVCMRKVNEEPCILDDTGVKITIPVRIDDIPTFRDRALRIYEWFDLQPRITGLDYKTLKPVTYALRTPSYGFIQSALTYESWNTPAHVIMGSIAYPLDWGQLEHELALIGIQPKAVKTLKELQKLVLFAEIGTIDITPSREALSYTKPSVRKLIQVLDNTLSSMSNEVRVTLDKCTNAFDAWITHDALHQSRIPQPILTANNTWCGVSLADAPRAYFPPSANVSLGVVRKDFETRRSGARHLSVYWENSYRYQTHHFDSKPPHLLWIHGKNAKKWHAILAHNHVWTSANLPLLLVKAEHRSAINQVQIAFDNQCRVTDLHALDPLPKRAATPRTPGAPRGKRVKNPGKNFTLRQLTIVPGERYLNRYDNTRFILSRPVTFNSVTDPVPDSGVAILGKFSNPDRDLDAGYLWDPLLPKEHADQRFFNGYELYRLLALDPHLLATTLYVSNYRAQKTVLPHITHVPTLAQHLTNRFTELDTLARTTVISRPYSAHAKDHELWRLFTEVFADHTLRDDLPTQLPGSPLLTGFALRRLLDQPAADFTYLTALNSYINRNSYTAPQPVHLPPAQCRIYQFLKYLDATYPLLMTIWAGDSTNLYRTPALHYFRLCDAAAATLLTTPVQLGVAA